jgi:hypothetical protein
MQTFQGSIDPPIQKNNPYAFCLFVFTFAPPLLTYPNNTTTINTCICIPHTLRVYKTTSSNSQIKERKKVHIQKTVPSETRRKERSKRVDALLHSTS